MPSSTTRYALQKPTVGGDADAWGGVLNTDLDDLDALLGALATTGSANAYALTTGLSLSAYADGQTFTVRANFANTGAATMNWDGLGAKNLRKVVSGTLTALASGDIFANDYVRVSYNSASDVIVIHGVTSTSFQPADATLTALAALSWSSGSPLVQFTAADTVSLTNSPVVTGSLTVNASGAAAPTPISGTAVHSVGAAATAALHVIDTFAAIPNFIGRRANGTPSSPTAILAGDTLLQFATRGYGATGYSATSRAAVNLLALENWTDAAQGAYGALRSTPAGSTTQADAYIWGNTASQLELGTRCVVPTTRNADYTLAYADNGHCSYHDEVTARTYTIPANASVPLPIGFTHVIDNTGNAGSAGAITVAITTDTLRRGDGVAGTGSRTVSANQVAVVRKKTATEWVITGSFT